MTNDASVEASISQRLETYKIEAGRLSNKISRLQTRLDIVLKKRALLTAQLSAIWRDRAEAGLDDFSRKGRMAFEMHVNGATMKEIASAIRPSDVGASASIAAGALLLTDDKGPIGSVAREFVDNLAERMSEIELAG